MPDFSSEIWIRDPILDGFDHRDGGLNHALELLDEAREEVAQIETVLGTDVAGSRTDLAERLAYRLAPSGLPKGDIKFYRGPNSLIDDDFDVVGWWTGGEAYIQFGRSGPFTGNNRETITFPQAYFDSPPTLPYVGAWFSPTTERTGWCVVDPLKTTATQFEVTARAWTTAGGINTPDQNWHCLWIAFGGFPSY